MTGVATQTEPGNSLETFLRSAGARCEVVMADGRKIRIGGGEPDFRIILKSAEAASLPPTEWAIGRAYITGEIDFEGNVRAVLALRNSMRPGMTWRDAVKFARSLFLQSPAAVNHDAIHDHYTLGDDFYLTFIDERYRFYSHCLFRSDDESLEEAAEHKLESMWNALGLRPGMRLLDIGGGWGGVAEYCSPRGVHVTSVTLVEELAAFIRALAERKNLSVDVVVGDFLDFVTDEPFDHAVIYGVIEHMPNGIVRLFGV